MHSPCFCVDGKVVDDSSRCGQAEFVIAHEPTSDAKDLLANAHNKRGD